MKKKRCLVVGLAVILITTVVSAPEGSASGETGFVSAWSALVAQKKADGSISPLEQEALRLMTPAQAAAFARGASAVKIVLRDGRTLAELLSGTGSFDLSWYTFEGGGLTSTGGAYALTGSIGQPDAGAMTGGAYRLAGGFLQAAFDDLAIFEDGFESGDVSTWSSAVGNI